jgi:surface antigen
MLAVHNISPGQSGAGLYRDKNANDTMPLISNAERFHYSAVYEDSRFLVDCLYLTSARRVVRASRRSSLFRVTSVLLVVTLTALAGSPAWSFWSWMRDAALTEFTDSDWAILKTEARRVLEDEPDGKRVDWRNPETGNSGSIRAVASLSFNRQPCRKVAFRQVTAKGTKGQGVYHLCRQNDATWKFVDEATIRAAGTGFLQDYTLLEYRPDDAGARAYIAPGALDKLATYEAIMIDQPEVLISPASKYRGAKPDHLKALADILRQAIVERFEAGGYTVTDQPGPGVVYMHWAVTDLYLKKKQRGSSSYTPADFVINTTAQAAISDIWRKIDIVELNVEAEFLDSASEALLAATIFERGARKNKATGQKQELVSWEDLDAAMRNFGERLRCHLDNARTSATARYDCASIVVEAPAKE